MSADIFSGLARVWAWMADPPMPRQLADGIAADDLDEDDLDQLAAAIHALWRRGPDAFYFEGREWRPLEHLDRAIWLEGFRRCGYIKSGIRAEQLRPAQPVTLWRLALPEGKAGLAWCRSRALALTWGRTYYEEEGARLYVARDVPPHRLLGDWDDEIVADVPRALIRLDRSTTEGTTP